MFQAGAESLQTLPPWMQIGIILVVALVAAKLVELVGDGLLDWSIPIASRKYNQIIIEELHVPLYTTVFLAGVYASAQLVPQFNLDYYISAIVLSVLLVLWAGAIIRLGKRIIAASNDSPSAREITPVFKNLLTFFIVLGTFLLLLNIWNIDITPILASAGVVGIVLGIAARDTIGNFFAGMSLYFDKTYKLGDMIQLASGERGTVIDMSIRSTTILTRDNIAITVPNAELNSTQVINESAPVRRRRIRLNVGVAYGSDLELVEETLLDAADTEEIILDSPSPVIRFQQFGDSEIVAQLQCYIEHPALRGRARHFLIRRINDRFDEEEIKIPFPQREMTFFESGNEIAIESDESGWEPRDTYESRPSADKKN